jgi:transcription elongation factor GreA
MTAAAQSPVSADVLTERLAFLRAERDRTRAEILPEGAGDVADRATNVDGLVRLSMLEERIAALEDELAEGDHGATPSADGVVAPGRLVTLDLGDGPEQFLLGSFEQVGGGVEVITSGSPLGRALVGASVGATVSYAARSNRHLQATVLAVD